LSDIFEVVDSTGHEHLVEAQRIPITRRDGNAWTIVNLKSGALVALVEQIVPEPDVEATQEGEEGAGPGDGKEGQGEAIDPPVGSE
jgi:hypothetical protein